MTGNKRAPENVSSNRTELEHLEETEHAGEMGSRRGEMVGNAGWSGIRNTHRKVLSFKRQRKKEK